MLDRALAVTAEVLMHPWKKFALVLIGLAAAMWLPWKQIESMTPAWLEAWPGWVGVGCCVALVGVYFETMLWPKERAPAQAEARPSSPDRVEHFPKPASA